MSVLSDLCLTLCFGLKTHSSASADACGHHVDTEEHLMDLLLVTVGLGQDQLSLCERLNNRTMNEGVQRFRRSLWVHPPSSGHGAQVR